MILCALALLAVLGQAEPVPMPATPARPPTGVVVVKSPAGARDDAAVPVLPPTRMGQELLSLDPLVVLVRTLRVTPYGLGNAVVRVQVEESLLPADDTPGRELLVLAYDGHFLPGSRDLLHLEPFRGGSRYRVIERVDGRDRDFAAKLAVTRATIALLALHERGAVDAACFELLRHWLLANDAWTRGYALGELRYLATSRRDLFTPERLAALAATAAASPAPVVAQGVALVTRIAQAAAPPVRSREPQENTSR